MLSIEEHRDSRKELSDILQGRDQYWNLDKRYDALSEFIKTCDDEETLVSLLDYVDNKQSKNRDTEQKKEGLYSSLRDKIKDIISEEPDKGKRHFEYLITEFEGKGKTFFYKDRLDKICSDLENAKLDDVSSEDIVDLQLLYEKVKNSSYLRAKMEKTPELRMDVSYALWEIKNKIDAAKSAYKKQVWDKRKKAVERFASNPAIPYLMAFITAVAPMSISNEPEKDAVPARQEVSFDFSNVDIESDSDLSGLMKNLSKSLNSNVDVPILVYHALGKDDSGITVTPSQFRKHLKMLYDEGYTLISMKEYEERDFTDVPEGRKPVVISFDDSTSSQFRYKKRASPDADFEISPNCAVGIMKKFYESHPDFGMKGIFFVDFHDAPFGNSALASRKLNQLIDLGFEVGSHGHKHIDMRKSRTEKIKKDADGFAESITSLLGERASEVKYFAYPFGAYKRDEKKDPVVGFEKGSVKFEAAFGPLTTMKAKPKPVTNQNQWRQQRVMIRSDVDDARFRQYLARRDGQVENRPVLAMRF